MRIVVITGLSGAGKTQVLHALEDLGFYCVDNLPVQLMAQSVSLIAGTHNHSDVALGVDVRSGALFDARETQTEIERLRLHGHAVDILYVDCSDDALISRFKETRREHLFAREKGLSGGIRLERAMLSPLRESATQIIDTTNLPVRSLTRLISQLYARDENRGQIIDILSFGYKKGLPREADMVLDVRFLPNPFYIPDLRDKTGLDASVYDYVLSFPAATVFVDQLAGMIDYLAPKFEEEGKPSLIIGIGCTGGQHRSVSIARALKQRLETQDRKITLSHRDI